MPSVNLPSTEPSHNNSAIIFDKQGFVKANVKNVSFDEVTSHDSGALIDEGSESHTQGQRRPSSYKHWKGRTTSDSIQYDNRLVESKADENSPFIVEVTSFLYGHISDGHLIFCVGYVWTSPHFRERL